MSAAHRELVLLMHFYVNEVRWKFEFTIEIEIALSGLDAAAVDCHFHFLDKKAILNGKNTYCIKSGSW